MKKDIILKWRNSDGRCTHKKNNHRHNGGLNDCVPKYCKHFEECQLKEGDTDLVTLEEMFDILKDGH